MVSVDQILRFTDEVARRFRPRQIILFGSYAYGKPTEDSDVDVLVVMPHEGPPYEKASEISLGVPHSFSCDLLVRSPETLRERIALNDFFLKEITEKGITLHDAADTGMGRKGRRRLRQRRARVAVA